LRIANEVSNPKGKTSIAHLHGVYAIIIEISREIAPQEEYKMEEIVRENIPACMYLINRANEFMKSPSL